MNFGGKQSTRGLWLWSRPHASPPSPAGTARPGWPHLQTRLQTHPGKSQVEALSLKGNRFQEPRATLTAWELKAPDAVPVEG